MTEDEQRRAYRLRAILDQLAQQQRRAELARQATETPDPDIIRYRQEKHKRAGAARP